ncbi:MAG TPA: cytidine deaminase [Bacillota bacterium]|nr:cytidine deaminase [Bacillota bacterium]HPZ21531.1 cytidine deaminase [Bacillota bacterium]HQD19602.1 cytidine deaminase [Bacillota bacterium]
MEQETKERLIQAALAARDKAYVPYSNYRVGAALLTKEGKIITGCNVENASYGLSNCAERTAIFKAVSEGERDFAGMAVAVYGKKAASPCGACRQVLREFFNDDAEIILVNEEGKGSVATMEQLLPGAFTGEDM